MEETFIETVVALYEQNEWEEVLKLSTKFSEDTVRRVLWVWPSVENLKFIKKHVEENNLDGVTSIGCGCGLLEWILQEFSKIPIVGYEVNEKWWNSKYSAPSFIKLTYPPQNFRSIELNPRHALLFCYFNNGPAFEDYVRVYEGNMVVIIGPGEGRGTFTDPDPFKVHFDDTWQLVDFQEVRNTKDFIAIYVRGT